MGRAPTPRERRPPVPREREPWFPALYDKPDVRALQALARGEANGIQQLRALDWIVTKAAMTYDQSFVPGKADVVNFLEGRRSVGNQIVKLLKLNLSALKGEETEQGN